MRVRARWHTLMVWSHIGDASFDARVQEVSASSSHCAVTFSLYVICNLWGDTWRLYAYSDPNYILSPPVLALVDDFFLTTQLHHSFYICQLTSTLKKSFPFTLFIYFHVLSTILSSPNCSPCQRYTQKHQHRLNQKGGFSPGTCFLVRVRKTQDRERSLKARMCPYGLRG